MKTAIKILPFLIVLLVFASRAVMAQEFEWVKAIGSTGIDAVNDVAVDEGGNIYVTGQFSGEVNFGNENGIRSTAIDTIPDAFFAKYTPAGELEFVRQLGSSGSTHGQNIKTDAQGNIYVLGGYLEDLSLEGTDEILVWTPSKEDGSDVFLAKYDANGNYIFSCRIGGQGHDFPSGLDVDAEGNIYITGVFNALLTFYSSAQEVSGRKQGIGQNDTFLAKYDAQGSLVFGIQVGGTDNDLSTALAIDAQNNIYLTGNFASDDFNPNEDPNNANKLVTTLKTGDNSGSNDIFVNKYDTNGKLIDAKGMGGGGRDSSWDMFVDAEGGIYLTGRQDKQADFDLFENQEFVIGDNDRNIFVAKYFPDFELDFAHSFGSQDDLFDRGYGIDVDKEGRIYITGEFETKSLNLDPQGGNAPISNAGLLDGFWAMYSPEGEQLLFSKQIGSSGNDIGKSIAVDQSGNVYVVGDFENTVTFGPAESDGVKTAGTVKDFYIVKYAPGIALSKTVTTNASGTTHLHASDLDGDGALDIISANGPENNPGASSITWYKNDGQGNFTPQPVVADGIQIPKSVFGVDIDNDGDRDILAAIRADNRIVWYENQDGSFEKNAFNLISDGLESPLALFPADFDKDGDLDVLAASRDDGKITWFENRLDEESNDFFPRSLDDAAESAQSVFAADLDGDGDLDALAAHRRNNGQISWYEVMGTDENARTLTLKEEVSLSGAEFVSAADFNNDGIPEVIGVSGNTISIYSMESGSFGTPQELGGINGGEAVSMADLDGDGDLDIVSASFNDHKIAWYENLGNATATFGSQKVISSAAEGARIVLTPDLDNDGRPDVLWASELINEIAWAKNQLFTPVNPSITTFNPPSAIQGNTITIFGTNFGDVPEVFFENGETSEEAPEVTPDNSGGIPKLLVKIPEILPKGSYQIKIIDAGKTVVSIDDLLIPTLPVPQVTELNPTSGPVGVALTIKGINFGADATKVQVKFGEATTYDVNTEELKSSNEISITVPDIPEDTYPVSVVVGSLESNTDKEFTITPPGTPVISSLSATSAPPGVDISISGELFGTEKGVVKVFFNETEIPATDFLLNSETEIEFTVPDLAPGSYNIKVTVEDKSSNEVAFTIAGSGAPFLSSIDPDTIIEGNTPTVTITGTGFGNNADNISVSFEDASEVTTDVTDGINVTDGTEISFTAPALAVGTYTVSVAVEETISDNTLTFTVQEDEVSGDNPPEITDVPPFGNTNGEVVITGDHFGTDTNNTSVTFDGNGQSAAGAIVNQSDDEITVDVPDDLAEGEYDVTIAVNGQQTTFGNKFIIDNTPPNVSATDIPLAEYFVPGAAKEFTITATDERSGVSSVNLEFSGIRETGDNVQSEALENNGNDTFTIDIQNLPITDDLGIEFHFSVTDNAGNTALFPEGDTRFLHKDQQNFTIPATRATNANDPQESDYNLVAVPLDELTRDQVFGDLGSFGGGAANDWWLFEYSAGNQSYTEVSSSSAALAPGKGYMLIFRNTATIQAQGKVLPVTPEQPVTVSIAPGFNLIGNPFPFSMDWDDVVAFNSDAEGVEELKFRKFDRGNWIATDNNFTRFEGGLVINPTTSAISLEIPFKKADTGGRYKQDEKKSKPQPLSAMTWEVPLRIETGDRYTLGGIGMHPEAAMGYDPMDDFTVPRFIDFLEVNFHHPEFFISKFTKDIVPTQDAYAWEFEVASNLSSPEVTLHWENHYFGNNGQALMLLDLHSHQVVNMREVTSYTFSIAEGSRKFKAFFGHEETVSKNMLPESIAVGEAYPNPMQNQFTIPVSLPNTSQYQFTMEIYNTIGQLVKRMHHKNMPAGYHRLQWDRTDTDGKYVRSGLYLYRIKVNEQLYDGRVIVK